MTLCERGVNSVYNIRIGMKVEEVIQICNDPNVRHTILSDNSYGEPSVNMQIKILKGVLSPIATLEKHRQNNYNPISFIRIPIDKALMPLEKTMQTKIVCNVKWSSSR